MSATFQPPRATYDVIFCRNLLIYFDANTQTRALAMLASLLAPGGVLVVGAADSFAARRAGFAPAPGYERSFLFRLESATREGDAPSVPTARARRLTLARPLVKPLVKTLPLRAQSRKPVAPRIEPKPRSFETSDGPAEKRALVDVARLADEGRLAEALSVGEAALRDGFVTAALLSLLGTTHAALPDLESAESCYRRALFLEPDNEDALLHLALLLEKRGETELANRYHARAKRALGRPALAMP
jgi:chemotaxis protein methyltransferase WspC